MQKSVVIPPVLKSAAKSALPPVLLLAAGLGIFVYLVRTPVEPAPDESRVAARLVRVIRAQRGPHRMTATAFGTTRASDEWTAIAEVSGRAVSVSERFEFGEIVAAHTPLVEIDPTDYQLAVDRLEAEIASQELRAEELEQRKTNLQKIADFQAEQLRLADEEFRRLRSLWEKDAASDSAMDAAQTALIDYQSAAQETRNRLDLIPVEKRLLDASLRVLEVQLKQAQRELEKCTIRLPFDARCASRSVEVDQFVAVGERLGTFLALDKAEVVAMVETRKMRALFPDGIPELGELDLTTMNLDESIFERFEVPAEVRWGPFDEPQVWRGRVARVGSTLDQVTRSVPVIVEIPDPYKDVVPGVRPPLVPDVFCHVTFYGATVDDVVVIPRDCLHEMPKGDARSASAAPSRNGADYRVYLLREGKLDIEPVEVIAQEADVAVIGGGIDDGDLVILTDLFPASQGMPLEGKLDETIRHERDADRPYETLAREGPETASSSPETPR